MADLTLADLTSTEADFQKAGRRASLLIEDFRYLEELDPTAAIELGNELTQLEQARTDVYRPLAVLHAKVAQAIRTYLNSLP